MTGGSKTYIPKKFYRTGGSKTYIPKNFYTKTTYITLLSEKFGGSGALPRPFYTSPMRLPLHHAITPLKVNFPYLLLTTDNGFFYCSYKPLGNKNPMPHWDTNVLFEHH
ncbi:hypothetical protein Hanom_Chr03g00199991 [Helianthus anomalus]